MNEQKNEARTVKLFNKSGRSFTVKGEEKNEDGVFVDEVFGDQAVMKFTAADAERLTKMYPAELMKIDDLGAEDKKVAAEAAKAADAK